MTEKIKYHPGFVGGLGVLLWKYRESIEIESEKWLSTEGIRMDVLLLKKDPEVILDHDICRVFRGHNIIEYKSPDDELSIDVFSKVMAYAYLYKSLGPNANNIPFQDLTATIYRHAYPRKLFRRLSENGIYAEKKGAGIYELKDAAVFPVQVIVGRELDPKEYAMFRVLTPNASKQDLQFFNKMAFQMSDAAYKMYVDSIFQVSFAANNSAYRELAKEDATMSDALLEFLEDQFQEKIQMKVDAAKVQAEAIGEIKGVIRLYHDEMGLAPADIINRIVVRFSLKKEEAEKYVEETLGLQHA